MSETTGGEVLAVPAAAMDPALGRACDRGAAQGLAKRIRKPAQELVKRYADAQV